MEKILAAAGTLGELISDSPQASTLKDLQSVFESDEELVTLMKEYQQQVMKMQQLEQSGSAIEVEDKQKFAQLREALMAKETFQKLNEAQTEYAELLRKVNEEIGSKIQMGGPQE